MKSLHIVIVIVALGVTLTSAFSQGPAPRTPPSMPPGMSQAPVVPMMPPVVPGMNPAQMPPKGPAPAPVMGPAAAAVVTPAPATTNAPAKAPIQPVETGPRDPFWPVGYTPKNEISPTPDVNPGTGETQPPVTNSVGKTNTVTAAQPAQPTVLRWPELKVKGLTRQANGSYLAIVDGVGIVEEGQVVTLQSQGMIFRIKITEITAKGIFQQKLDCTPAKKQ